MPRSGHFDVSGPRHISDAERTAVETEQMFVVETGQMCAVGTGQMTAAETSVLSQNKTSVLSQQCPWLLRAAMDQKVVRKRRLCFVFDLATPYSVREW